MITIILTIYCYIPKNNVSFSFLHRLPKCTRAKSKWKTRQTRLTQTWWMMIFIDDGFSLDDSERKIILKTKAIDNEMKGQTYWQHMTFKWIIHLLKKKKKYCHYSNFLSLEFHLIFFSCFCFRVYFYFNFRKIKKFTY